LVLVLFTFYIQGVPKFKKNNSVAKKVKEEISAAGIYQRLQRACGAWVGAVFEDG